MIYNRAGIKKEALMVSNEMIEGDACDEDLDYIVDCILKDKPINGLSKLEYVINSEFD